MKHNFKKKYGQNFLRNDVILDDIVNSFDVDKNSIIVEVGPGDGALTKKLLTKNVNVIAFEIDESLRQFLDQIKSDRLDIHYLDFLTINLNNYFNKDNKIYLVANIPYYITTPIITKFINEKIIPECMILMVQKEVAERLTAHTHTSEYGAISVILNYFFELEYLFTVDRNNFYPVPNVDSAVIKLSKRNKFLELKDFEIFKELVMDAFKYKRKNLRNNLKNYDLVNIELILKKHSLNLTNRAEDIDYKVFVEIANKL